MNIRLLIHLFVYYVGGLFSNEMFFCSHAYCNRTFNSRSGRDRHVKFSHQTREKEYCRYGCGKSYPKGSYSLRHHHQTCDNNRIGYGINQQFFAHAQSQSPTTNGFQLEKTAHNGNYKMFRYTVHSTKNIHDELRNILKHDVRDIIQQVRQNIKFIITINCIFEKSLRPGIYTNPPVYFKTLPVTTTLDRDLDNILTEMNNDLWSKIENYVQNGSGWCLRQLVNIDLEVCPSGRDAR